MKNTKPRQYVQPYIGEYGETTFFVHSNAEGELVEGLPDHFTVKGMPFVPKGTLLYLHPDIVGPGFTFRVKDSCFSVTAQPPADETFVLEDGRKYSIPVAHCSMRQEVILQLVPPRKAKS